MRLILFGHCLFEYSMSHWKAVVDCAWFFHEKDGTAS